MKRLYQDIQNQINDLMESNFARKSDAQLSQIEKRAINPEVIKNIHELYLNGSSVTEISKKFNLSPVVVHKYLKRKKIDTSSTGPLGFKKAKIHEEKTNDILNGMGVHEFCEKWNTPYKGYYSKRCSVFKKFKKDLADSK